MPRTTRVCGLTLLDAVPRPVTMARMNRILIVDDNAGFRLQARALLEADGFDVVGESTDGLSGLSDARRLRPDLVLLDIGLPDIEGFEVARALADDGPAAIRRADVEPRGDRIRPAPHASRVLGFLPKDELSGPAIRALADAA